MGQQFQKQAGREPERRRGADARHDESITHSAHTITLPASSILRLQRAIGNQAVMRLMNRQSSAANIQRKKEIHEDVMVYGKLVATEMLGSFGDINAANGKFENDVKTNTVTANDLGAHSSVQARTALFEDEAMAKKFTEIGGATETISGQNTPAPTGSGTSDAEQTKNSP